MIDQGAAELHVDRFGFNRYEFIQQQAPEHFLRVLARAIPRGDWAILGGAAIVLHFGRDNRIVSPDLDLCVLPGRQFSLKREFGVGAPGLFGFSLHVGGLAVDVLIAAEAWQRNAVRSSDLVSGYPVMSLPYLIIAKIIANRAKDLDDLCLVQRLAPETFVEARRLCERAGVEVDDFDATHALIRHLASLDPGRSPIE